MVKAEESSEDPWLKIKHTSEILNPKSPTKITRAILNGGNPPDLTFKALSRRVERLLKKRDENGKISPKRSPGSGRPTTVATPKTWDGLKR